MRILISTPHLGGSGGIERHVASTIRCLGEHHEIDVWATHLSPSGYSVRPRRGRVLTPEPTWSKVHRRLRGTHHRRAPYDAYLYYQHARDVQDFFSVGARMVIPCGDDVRHLERRFDAVLLEAPDNARLVEDQSKAVLLPPPLNVPADHAEPVGGVPDEFFLTVFNPHHPRKGLADLRAVAHQSPLPFVWCRAGRFAAEHPADELDGIVALEDRTQEELRYLYEHCRAYVSFDHNRGFGWSLADALQYGTPTLSRGLGVMSIPGVDHTGCVVYESNDELLAHLQAGDFTRSVRDLGDLSPPRFVQRFEALVRVLEVVRSSRSRSACG
jgi:glycosyltransferase involved in cell wall biosynthesis